MAGLQFGAEFSLPPIPRPEDRNRRGLGILFGLAGIALATLYLMFYASFALSLPEDGWLGFFVGPLVFMGFLPVLLRMLRRVEPDPKVRNVVVVGYFAKLLGGFARFTVGELVLGNNDSGIYHIVGSDLAGEFRSLVFGGPVWESSFGFSPGTDFLRLLTGVIYTFTGSSFTVGFVTFSFMSFWGLYFYFRAFAIAMPEGMRYRYALLVFLLPSMVFWPSSIGKDAWMSLSIGLAAYGMARILTFRSRGYLLMALGMVGMAVVRPHVAAIFGVGLVGALILRRSHGTQSATARKLLGLVVLAVGAGILLSQLQAFFGIESALEVNAVFDETSRRTSQGGSQFESVQPTSPVDLPWAVVTVLFRPFIFEAGGPAGLVAALEGTLLLSLFAFNISRILRLPSQMVQQPYLAFAVLYTLVFVFAFSAINNFGILSRQRTQLFPVTVVMLCIPADRHWNGKRADLEPYEGGLTILGLTDADAEHDNGQEDRKADTTDDEVKPLEQVGATGDADGGQEDVSGPSRPRPIAPYGLLDVEPR